MISELFFYQLMLIALLWLCVMLHGVWPSDTAVCPMTPAPPPPRPKRKREPKPFAGLTRKPPCDACKHASGLHPPALAAPPPRIIPTRGRTREVDTSRQFCPTATCDYRDWVDWGNVRANGHPSGGPWRQFYCMACEGYFQRSAHLEHHSTMNDLLKACDALTCMYTYGEHFTACKGMYTHAI